MPIIPISVSYATELRSLPQLIKEASLEGKAWDEIVFSFDAIKVWRAWFHTHYGELQELRHHSNPDDPPDISLIFERKQLGLEHTFLKPHPLGFAEAISRDVNPGGGRFIPSISRKWTRSELLDLSSGVAPHWANVKDEYDAAFSALISSVLRKVKHPASQIICVTDRVTIGDAHAEWLASRLWDFINKDKTNRFVDRIIIFTSRLNDFQFFSALIKKKDQFLAYRNGEPIKPRLPLSY